MRQAALEKHASIQAVQTVAAHLLPGSQGCRRLKAASARITNRSAKKPATARQAGLCTASRTLRHSPCPWPPRTCARSARPGAATAARRTTASSDIPGRIGDCPPPRSCPPPGSGGQTRLRSCMGSFKDYSISRPDAEGLLVSTPRSTLAEHTSKIKSGGSSGSWGQKCSNATGLHRLTQAFLAACAPTGRSCCSAWCGWACKCCRCSTTRGSAWVEHNVGWCLT